MFDGGGSRRVPLAVSFGGTHHRPHSGIEQLAARRSHNPEVGGSSPSPVTITILKFAGNPRVKPATLP